MESKRKKTAIRRITREQLELYHPRTYNKLWRQMRDNGTSKSDNHEDEYNLTPLIELLYYIYQNKKEEVEPAPKEEI